MVWAGSKVKDVLDAWWFVASLERKRERKSKASTFFQTELPI
jgi:hypothetical protein